MFKVINFLMFLAISIFIFKTYTYYSSSKNIDKKNFNLENIEKIMKNKITNLPVLINDTNDVIEFNNSLTNENYDNKKRSFWDLLKK